MSQDRGNWLAIATALFFSWAALSLLVRVWVKLRRWGWEDSVVCVAFVLIVGHVAATLLAVSDGYGRPFDDVEVGNMGVVEVAMYASQLTYVVAMGLTRVSVALFISHLTRFLPQVRTAYMLTGLSAAWTLAACLVVALRGNLTRPWGVLEVDHVMWIKWIVIESTGLGIELAIWVMSLTMIWGLKMKTYKRVLIVGAFGFRLGLVPIVILRILYLSPSRNTNPTVTDVVPGMLTEAALEYALFACSITALKPFLKPFYSGAIVNTVGGAGSGLAYASQQHGTLPSTRRSRADPEDEDEIESDLSNIADDGSFTGTAASLDIKETPAKEGWQGSRSGDSDEIRTVTSSGGSREIVVRIVRS